jgi:hypothetical protein
LPLDAPHAGGDCRDFLRTASLSEHKTSPQVFKVSVASCLTVIASPIELAFPGGVATLGDWPSRTFASRLALPGSTLLASRSLHYASGQQRDTGQPSFAAPILKTRSAKPGRPSFHETKSDDLFSMASTVRLVRFVNADVSLEKSPRKHWGMGV